MPEAMASVLIQTTLGPVMVPAELFGSYLAVTPATEDDGSGVARLAGGFAVTHLSTGWAVISFAGCVGCARVAARRLAELVDWSAVLDVESIRAASPGWPAEALDIIRSRREVSCWCSACGVGRG